MKQKKIDFTNLLRKYKSGWVGISADFKKVTTHGKTLNEVLKKAKLKKEKVYAFPAGEVYSDFVGQNDNN